MSSVNVRSNTGGSERADANRRWQLCKYHKARLPRHAASVFALLAEVMLTQCQVVFARREVSRLCVCALCPLRKALGEEGARSSAVFQKWLGPFSSKQDMHLVIVARRTLFLFEPDTISRSQHELKQGKRHRSPSCLRTVDGKGQELYLRSSSGPAVARW